MLKKIIKGRIIIIKIEQVFYCVACKRPPGIATVNVIPFRQCRLGGMSYAQKEIEELNPEIRPTVSEHLFYKNFKGDPWVICIFL